jgi:hypothetical protein
MMGLDFFDLRAVWRVRVRREGKIVVLEKRRGRSSCY